MVVVVFLPHLGRGLWLVLSRFCWPSISCCAGVGMIALRNYYYFRIVASHPRGYNTLELACWRTWELRLLCGCHAVVGLGGNSLDEEEEGTEGFGSLSPLRGLLDNIIGAKCLVGMSRCGRSRRKKLG